MTLKRYLWTMAMTTLVCWGAFVVVLFRIDPETGGSLALALFFSLSIFRTVGNIEPLRVLYTLPCPAIDRAI